MNSHIKVNNSKSPPLSIGDNHNYVNLNQTHTGTRPPSYQESSLRSVVSSNNKGVVSPNPNRMENLQINKSYEKPAQSTPLPQNWYSPPSSVKSFSRPPSFADANIMPFKNNSKVNSLAFRQVSVVSKNITPKTPNKLQTIDEDNMGVSIDKLLQLCAHSDDDLQANALGYLQHLTYNNPENKMQVRDYNGLPVLISHIESENNYVARAALGVLKNISFTDIEMITTDIERLGGIQKLVYIVYSTDDISQKELAIDILWNLSVKYNLKPIILTDVVPVLLNSVIRPDSGMIRQEAGNYVEGEEDIIWSTMLRNALGIIRNVSYENVKARSALRKVDGLIDCIMYIIFQSGNRDVEEYFDNRNQMALIDTKIVENCVCILRNLTYAIQEIVDVNYLEKRQNSNQKTNKTSKKGNSNETVMIAPPPSSGVAIGVELLWNSKYIVTALFPILKNGANAVTLEAAAGVTQNLTAGDWEPSKEMQIQFRHQLALPTLIELIDFGTNEVIRSAATALRNLVQENFCRMLVGTNGLHHLADKIPLSSHSKKIDPTALAAVLSTIYVIVLDQVEFMKDFVSIKGAKRCMYVRDNDEFIVYNDSFPDKVKIFSQCILDLLWKTPSVQDLMKKDKIKQSDINQTNRQAHAPVRFPGPDDVDSNNVRLHDSIVSDQPYGMSKYPSDERYLRDSAADVVSNQGLRERNSLAYTTNLIHGYGDVRLPTSNKVNGQGRLGTINSVSNISSVNGATNRTKTPTHNSRSNDIKLNNNNYMVPSRGTTPISDQRVNAYTAQSNRYSSNNPSHHSKAPKPSQDLRNGNISLAHHPDKRVSTNSNYSDKSYVYSKPIKPKPIPNITPRRQSGHSAV